MPKLEAHDALLLDRVEVHSDIAMPELAAELQSATGVCAAPTLSRWMRSNDYHFKNDAAAALSHAELLNRKTGKMH